MSVNETERRAPSHSTDFENEMRTAMGDMRERQVRMEEKLKQLFDNGQPGELSRIKSRIDVLEKSKQWFSGAGSTIGAGAAATVALIEMYLRLKG